MRLRRGAAWKGPLFAPAPDVRSVDNNGRPSCERARWWKVSAAAGIDGCCVPGAGLSTIALAQYEGRRDEELLLPNWLKARAAISLGFTTVVTKLIYPERALSGKSYLLLTTAPPFN